MFKSQKHVFWQALLAALVVFFAGIFLGYVLESSRVGEIKGLYLESELSLLDVKIQSELYGLGEIDCEEAVKENIKFGDRVFEEAKILERFEDSSKITEGIKLQHKKYDLLRTLFWLNSLKIKERCNGEYHTIVYFYDYNEPSIEKKAEQEVFSRVLGELKKEFGDEVMLIPIAGDNDITAVEIILKMYDIDVLPTVLIDENVKIVSVESLEFIRGYLR